MLSYAPSRVIRLTCFERLHSGGDRIVPCRAATDTDHLRAQRLVQLGDDLALYEFLVMLAADDHQLGQRVLKAAERSIKSQPIDKLQTYGSKAQIV